MDISQAGKLILIAGVVLVIVGGLFMLAGRIPLIGQLPGDIRYERGNMTFYVPLATMILLSIILTILLNIWFRR